MRTLVLLALGTLTVTALTGCNPSVPDEEAIIGTWQMTQRETHPSDPVGMTSEEYEGRTIEFKRDGKTVDHKPDREDMEYEYKLEPTAKVKTINITRRGEVQLGVYTLDGDTLQICWGLYSTDGNTPPRPDAVKAGKGFILTTFKRAKDK
jgi:uncharacterized protein (TIGR03067 family)